MKNNVHLKKKFVIPIYGAVLWIIVANDIHEERVKMSDIFGPPPKKGSYEALASYDNAGTFGLFFETIVGIDQIAHEVFHLTHRILNWTNSNFGPEHHEQGALLNGYLMEVVMKEVAKFPRVKFFRHRI